MNNRPKISTSRIMKRAEEWPGKSNGHLAIWHMLDVAACAELLLKEHHLFKCTTESERNALLILIALHDVGKISNEFLKRIKGCPVNYFHWQLSDVLLKHCLNDEILEPAFKCDKYSLGILYAAVSGHHGGPERNNNRLEIRRRKNAIGGLGIEFAKDWTRCLLEIFPDASLEGLDEDTAKKISWVLSGLVVAADWIGSNEEWFKPQLDQIKPKKYWKKSHECAVQAVKKAGLDPVLADISKNGKQLVGLNNLRPMQLAVETATLPDEPFLAFMEDSTGSGKTEAAIILAHRMLMDKKANGLYFALPTMATANAMFSRMKKIISRIFSKVPTLSLVHGRSHLHEGYRNLVGIENDTTAEANCTLWLADDRRRSLLAHVGVGTIDQALFGILPTKFATLRLYGLTNRILIVDEAHAYDPYMQRQLETLLRMHGMNGGSAIIMTATLPIPMRQAYADAYCKGRGMKTTNLDYSYYPGLAFVGSSVSTQPVEPVETSCRSIIVDRATDTKDADSRIIKGVESGATCVWIRNSVDEAISTTKEFISKGYDPKLLHARFALGDRLKIEEGLINQFGRKGKNRSREIVIATQVIEASLDLDFDVMISDLAPIGALIQRAGRLWRHMDIRPETLRPVPGPNLTVLSPDPESVRDDQWLHNVLDGGAWVYDIGDLWRTAKILFSLGEIKSPDNLREIINFVHGDQALEVPQPLIKGDFENIGKHMAEFAQAQNNVVIVMDGYLMGTGDKVWSDEKFPTRLGEETSTLVLAKRESSGLLPWCNDNSEARAWALSEVSCSKRRLNYYRNNLPDQSRDDIHEVKKLWSQAKRKHFILCPVEEDGYICDGLKYSSKLGLEFETNPLE